MIAPRPDREFEFNERDFQYIVEVIGEKTGIVLEGNKTEMIYSRMARRLRALRFESFAQYRKYLESPEGANELGEMINALTTNLTKFFRENHHFEHLGGVVLKNIMTAARGSKARIRIWSAGCSSGQEPFSIAMTIARTIPSYRQHDIRILATDLDSNMVARGRAAKYSKSEVESIPADLRNRYLTPLDDAGRDFQFVDEIREMIVFNPLNLLHEWPIRGPFDAIFMRNVIIYFNNETQAHILERMRPLLRPTSFLYIGHSENIGRVTDLFVSGGQTIYRLAPSAHGRVPGKAAS